VFHWQENKFIISLTSPVSDFDMLKNHVLMLLLLEWYTSLKFPRGVVYSQSFSL